MNRPNTCPLEKKVAQSQHNGDSDQTDTDLTFCLTSGGHNAGIVCEPGNPRRRYRLTTRQADDKYVDPDTWQGRTRQQEGSWWPAWHSRGHNRYRRWPG
jgi:poly(3-hydroxyalkanoate) synthetase